jgi:oligo-1,6-glucosidase
VVAVSFWGNDSPEWRELSSKMLTTFLMTMRATPYYYYGDELGMNNIKFDRIEDYRDIETLNVYKKLQQEGGDLKAFIESQKNGGARDNGRTPFQWDATAQAGFTTGTPWLNVNPNYLSINAAAQEKDANAVLNYFRNIVKLRKSEPVLIYGKYTLLDKENPDIYAYTRELNGKTLLVLLNFRDKAASTRLGLDISKAKLLINNYETGQPDGKGDAVNLRPYEAAVLEL